MAQLAEYVATNPTTATYNGKPFFMLINETCQKKNFAAQVSDNQEFVAVRTTAHAVHCAAAGNRLAGSATVTPHQCQASNCQLHTAN